MMDSIEYNSDNWGEVISKAIQALGWLLKWLIHRHMGMFLTSSLRWIHLSCNLSSMYWPHMVDIFMASIWCVCTLFRIFIHNVMYNLSFFLFCASLMMPLKEYAVFEISRLLNRKKNCPPRQLKQICECWKGT